MKYEEWIVKVDDRLFFEEGDEIEWEQKLVRCKDCKKWETINCPFARDFVKWDGFKFCAWGERRED